LAVDFKGAEVVFAVRVIVLREIAEGLNRQDNARLHVERQFVHAGGQHDPAADKGGAEVVIE
jgi:hypothetical protein